MAKPGARYPQVDAAAAALMERRVAYCASTASVAAALARAHRSGVEAFWFGDGGAVRRAELQRVMDWGLGALRASAVAWSALPSLSVRAPEIEVRRRLLGGASLILVRDGRRVVGIVDALHVELARPALSVAHRLERLESGSGDGVVRLLRVAGKAAEAMGAPVFAVGGFVRDLLLDRLPADVDLVVEGDGVAFARRLVEEVGGRLVAHGEFGTACIEGGLGPGGASRGRIDIASTRREQYRAPGALPVVSSATVGEDLARRDFSVNAMAVALWPSVFGRLLDPFGGQADLAQRRLRPLFPLAFVEDPTRAFRAARYCARLGLRVDAVTARALALMVCVGRYPALSGQRLRAELALLAGEDPGWRGLELALGWKLFALWDAGYRSGAAGRRALRAAAGFSRWAGRTHVDVDRTEVALTALLMHQRPRVVDRCLARLTVSGAPSARVRAAATAAPLARRLDAAKLSPSEVADRLRAQPMTVMAGMWLYGSPRVRRRLEWFLTRGRSTRPQLSGQDLICLGVSRGPALGRCLAALRRLRLDGAVTSIGEEREFVRQWRQKRRRV
jgi:tRNA nucleotidyltransferase (CCA-adding enzyme)